jgi:NitT/TauT family transport system permease protein
MSLMTSKEMLAAPTLARPAAGSVLALLFYLFALVAPLATHEVLPAAASIGLLIAGLCAFGCTLISGPLAAGLGSAGWAIASLALLPASVASAGLGLHAGSLWLGLVGAAIQGWTAMGALSRLRLDTGTVLARLLRLAIPAMFGIGLVIAWQVLVVGFGVPQILLPSPGRIMAALVSHAPVLLADFRQTVLKSVIAGYVMGCGIGFVLALLADQFSFLRRGLLPVGNLVSAIPIVGIAPIMVMWFGFDWQSKAAVVVVMTVFPMLISSLAGFAAVDRMHADLMTSYGARGWQSFTKLVLPGAMPHIFNALKLNSTLALIGAIVAEFFGTPIVGMGFRISTEIARMNVDVVWATIVVAALTGSLFYGLLALTERLTTFWHPSHRGGH